MPQLYDTIGVGYGSYRRPDRRIAAAIMRARWGASTPRECWRRYRLLRTQTAR